MEQEKLEYDAVKYQIRQLIKEKLILCLDSGNANSTLLDGTKIELCPTFLVEFIRSLEDRFDVVIPEEDLCLDNFATIERITDYITKRIAK